MGPNGSLSHRRLLWYWSRAHKLDTSGSIAIPEALRSYHIQDHARVCLGGHREAYVGGDIGLEQCGNNIYSRPLSGQDQMNACSPSQLSQAHQLGFGIPASSKHQLYSRN